MSFRGNISLPLIWAACPLPLMRRHTLPKVLFRRWLCFLSPSIAVFLRWPKLLWVPWQSNCPGGTEGPGGYHDKYTADTRPCYCSRRNIARAGSPLGEPARNVAGLSCLSLLKSRPGIQRPDFPCRHATQE